ncbi:uncharacterized protein LOC129584826 isoform X2 [Paramacrobiotus metropolitanus]|uniref:uncharacterized protein LOC129584826 isoform X2 n=1 Tax=Paramacrobiotus metropolitanus TaxID=2943436 RepID=UPI0024465B38|nr:uncharacterized protein LOC129584826 isoform X2 [Paramacrobiotus metropolitanus]
MEVSTNSESAVEPQFNKVEPTQKELLRSIQTELKKTLSSKLSKTQDAEPVDTSHPEQPSEESEEKDRSPSHQDEMVVEDSYPDIRTVARDSVHYDLDPTGLLITPRKPLPPGRDNPDMRELHRELAFNNKMGINVLGQKSELQKAMEKMRGQVTRKQLEEEKKNQRSDLEREFEKRAMRLKDYENAVAAEPAIPYQPVDEFHRMHAKVAKVNGRFASATS